MTKFITNYRSVLLDIIGGLIVICFLLLVDAITYRHVANIDDNNKIIAKNEEKVSSENKTIEEEKIEVPKVNPIDELITNKNNELTFYSNTFGIDKTKLTELIKNDLNNNMNDNIKSDFDRYILNYLKNLENTNKELFNNNIIPCNKNKEYIIALISYFTKLYDDVDFSIASSIAFIESGYSSRYMLNNNNIFGGMSGGRLIRYKNIEYGIYKFIDLLHEGYFSQGLTTVDTIGRKYNPVFENGVKKGNPFWVRNVTKCLNRFDDYKYISNLNEVNLYLKG